MTIGSAPVRVLGRIEAADGTLRQVEVDAVTHAAAKIWIKGQVSEDERLLFIRVVRD